MVKTCAAGFSCINLSNATFPFGASGATLLRSNRPTLSPLSSTRRSSGFDEVAVSAVPIFNTLAFGTAAASLNAARSVFRSK